MLQALHPKLSIITVVFNGASTLEKTINSVLSQTYDNIEYILVDGGSTDNTIEILKKYDDSNLSWVSEPDKGIYDAMNKGIERASGDWLYFLGADDQFYNNNVLKAVFGETDIMNYDFIYGNVKSEAFKNVYDGEFDFEKLLKKNISHQAIFCHKNIFLTIGKYNLKYKTHADWDFNLRCFENNEMRIKYVNEIIAEFGKGGVSSNYDIPFLRESLLPRKLRLLESDKSSLYNIKNYDEWWRFIRNMGLRSEEDFKESGYDLPLSGVVLSMVKMQKKLPKSWLRKGIFSKMCMFTNYLFNYYKIKN